MTNMDSIKSFIEYLKSLLDKSPRCLSVSTKVIVVLLMAALVASALFSSCSLLQSMGIHYESRKETFRKDSVSVDYPRAAIDSSYYIKNYAQISTRYKVTKKVYPFKYER